jgi:hypothetical protein
MNDGDILIKYIIYGIIIIQIAVFLRTISKINIFKKIFFPIDHFRAHTVYIPSDEIKDIKPGEIVHNLAKYLNSGEEEQTLNNEIMLIDTTKPRGKILASILDSLNTYLIRNKGAVSDFSLMKDIVERNCEAIDEDINTSLPVPLYMGLMGTMIGIVVGLYFVTATNLVSDTAINSIGGLIGGVRIAMISSLVGLLCTTVGQGFLYKRIKTQVESKKHAFYTFLQTELLPVLDKNVNSTIHELQRNLTNFNDGFKSNVDKFDGFMESVHESFKSPTELLRLVKDMDINQIASANISVLKELKGSIGEMERFTGAIEKFGVYFIKINSFIYNAEELNKNLLAQLERTSSVESLVKKIELITTENEKLTEFFNSHFSALEKYSSAVNETINYTENNLKKEVESFSDFTRKSIDELRKFVIAEERTLQTRLQTSGLLDELKNLSNVKTSMENMETLSKEQKVLIKAQNTKLETLDTLAKSIDDLVSVGKKINRHLFWGAVILGGFIAIIMLLNLTGIIDI